MAKTFEGQSRLVCLAYQVLSKIDAVVPGKTDGELMAILVAAFHQHATEVADAEFNPRSGARGKPALQEVSAYLLRTVAA